MCQRSSRLKDPAFSCETKLNQLPSLVKIVWERYYSAMAAGPEISQRALAELVAQLGRMGYRDVDTGGLTPAQWTALRFFSRVNRFSRNVSAFVRRRIDVDFDESHVVVVPVLSHPFGADE